MNNVFYLLLLFIVINIYANGGPSDYSRFEKSGDIVLHNVKDVVMLSEKLDIDFQGKRTIVSVIYELENRSKTQINTGYSFPITVSDQVTHIKEIVSQYSLDKVLFGPIELDGYTEPEIFAYFNLKINEKEVKTTPKLDEEKEIIWMNGQISLPPGITKLMVDYDVLNAFTDSENNTSIMTQYSDRWFIYDFSPAAGWGNGIVENLSIHVTISDYIQNFINSLVLPADLITVSENGNTYKEMQYTKKNVDLSSFDSLFISADYSSVLTTEDIENSKITLPNPAIKIKASSELNNYPISNLSDGNFSTGWVVPGGENSWIEISIDTAQLSYNISGIFLLNGYWKSEKTYSENSRFESANVKVRGPGWDNEDYVSNSTVYYYADTLKLNKKYYGNKAVEMFSLNDGGPSSVINCKITFEDILSGSKYDELVISEIILLGRSKD